MIHSPTAHARDASSAISRRLATARADECACGERLLTIEAELAVTRASKIEKNAPAGVAVFPDAHRTALLNQRIANLIELRASLIAERTRRRREIDEMTQRKEAVDAALAVLRGKAAEQVGLTR